MSILAVVRLGLVKTEAHAQQSAARATSYSVVLFLASPLGRPAVPHPRHHLLKDQLKRAGDAHGKDEPDAKLLGEEAPASGQRHDGDGQDGGSQGVADQPVQRRVVSHLRLPTLRDSRCTSFPPAPACPFRETWRLAARTECREDRVPGARRPPWPWRLAR